MLKLQCLYLTWVGHSEMLGLDNVLKSLEIYFQNCIETLRIAFSSVLSMACSRQRNLLLWYTRYTVLQERLQLITWVIADLLHGLYFFVLFCCILCVFPTCALSRSTFGHVCLLLILITRQILQIYHQSFNCISIAGKMVACFYGSIYQLQLLFLKLRQPFFKLKINW